MTPILFLMARHGLTFLNQNDEYRGWSNGPDAQLNDKGIQQARELGIFISKLDVNITHIFCSNLERAELTAKIVSEILGLSPKDIIVEPRLRPLNVGDLAGKKKVDFPIDEYLADINKRFPNGETIAEFEARQHDFAEDILALLQSGELKYESVLMICHVSNVMYWVNVQTGADSEEYLGETTDIIGPGGLAMVTDDDVIPMLNRNDNAKQPMKDGTPLSGFVTFRENRPPRECWNCRYFDRDQYQIGSCGHPLVRIDEQIPDFKERKLQDGRLMVGDRDCCDNFRNHSNT